MDNDREDGCYFVGSQLKRRQFLKSAASVGVVAIPASLASMATSAATAGSNGAAAAQTYAKPFAVSGYASKFVGAALEPFNFERRAVGANDVVIDIQFCGVCHSDIHTADGHWGPQRYPLVTGHEIAGLVVAVGSGVGEFRIGDRVGVGCMVNSCGHCTECTAGFEQFCEEGPTMTYGTEVPTNVEPTMTTQGGYSNAVVVNKNFVIKIPHAVELAAAGPLMCAAITVYSPMRHWGVKKGWTIGIAGMGGLGHLAVKIAKALGAEVVVFTSSPDKVNDAKRFGASDVVVNYDQAKLKQYAHKLDFILNTIPVHHEMDPLVGALKRDATMCLVGIGDVKQANQLSPFTTIQRRNSFAGSLIGGIRETQEVVDFCNLHGILPEYKLVQLPQINGVWDDVAQKKARYRYVLDLRRA